MGPPVGDRSLLPQLLDAALVPACRHAGAGPVWAALESTPEAEELLPAYLETGLVLRALRPLNGLAPCWLFSRVPGQRQADPVWVPLADRARLAALLSRGWSAVGSEATDSGTAWLCARCNIQPPGPRQGPNINTYNRGEVKDETGYFGELRHGAGGPGLVGAAALVPDVTEYIRTPYDQIAGGSGTPSWWC